MKLESKKEIKIGDIVKIRTWESMEKEYGLDEDGKVIQLRFSEKEESEHDTRWWFTEEMFEQKEDDNGKI